MFHPWQLLIATASSELKIWSLETGQCRQTLNDHHSLVVGMAFAPDGQTFATGGYDATIRIWDVNSWHCRMILRTDLLVQSVAFSPDGTTLVAGGDNGTLQRWDLATAQCIHVLQLGAVV